MKPAHKLMHWYREWSRVQNARVCGSLLRKSPPRISRSPGQHAPRSASKTDLALNVTYGTGESGHPQRGLHERARPGTDTHAYGTRDELGDAAEHDEPARA